MFAGIIKTIKVLGNAKAKLEAIDDDVDLDGKRELDQLKDRFENIKGLAVEMIPEVKAFFQIALRLIDHVAKAG